MAKQAPANTAYAIQAGGSIHDGRTKASNVLVIRGNDGEWDMTPPGGTIYDTRIVGSCSHRTITTCADRAAVHKQDVER